VSTSLGRRLVILRHGETSHNAQGVWQGQLDSALSERGLEQARAAGLALKAMEPSRVVASDLQRAAHTGQAVAEAAGVPISYDERWREIHAGLWQGLTGEEVRTRWPEEQEKLLRGEDFPRGGHGETVADVAKRTAEALDDLIADMAEGETVIVVTHGVSGRAAVAELIGMDQGTAWTALGGLANCHWAELTEGARQWRLNRWNVAPTGVEALPGHTGHGGRAIW
jgi:broad specificity phosphatase PhoE